MKKIILTSAATLAAVSTPIIAAVSCGETRKEEKGQAVNKMIEAPSVGIAVKNEPGKNKVLDYSVIPKVEHVKVKVEIKKANSPKFVQYTQNEIINDEDTIKISYVPDEGYQFLDKDKGPIIISRKIEHLKKWIQPFDAKIKTNLLTKGAGLSPIAKIPHTSSNIEILEKNKWIKYEGKGLKNNDKLRITYSSDGDWYFASNDKKTLVKNFEVKGLFDISEKPKTIVADENKPKAVELEKEAIALIVKLKDIKSEIKPSVDAKGQTKLINEYTTLLQELKDKNKEISLLNTTVTYSPKLEISDKNKFGGEATIKEIAKAPKHVKNVIKFKKGITSKFEDYKDGTKLENGNCLKLISTVEKGYRFEDGTKSKEVVLEVSGLLKKDAMFNEERLLINLKKQGSKYSVVLDSTGFTVANVKGKNEWNGNEEVVITIKPREGHLWMNTGDSKAKEIKVNLKKLTEYESKKNAFATLANKWREEITSAKDSGESTLLVDYNEIDALINNEPQTYKSYIDGLNQFETFTQKIKTEAAKLKAIQKATNDKLDELQKLVAGSKESIEKFKKGKWGFFIPGVNISEVEKITNQENRTYEQNHKDLAKINKFIENIKYANAKIDVVNKGTFYTQKELEAINGKKINSKQNEISTNTNERNWAGTHNYGYPVIFSNKYRLVNVNGKNILVDKTKIDINKIHGAKGVWSSYTYWSGGGHLTTKLNINTGKITFAFSSGYDPLYRDPSKG